MKNKIVPFLLALAILSSLACKTVSSIPEMLNLPPTPSMDNLPSGPSPMSGDWHADTPFGSFSFTVDPNGTTITTAVFQVSNWTCGGTTLTTQVQSLSQWPITDGHFEGYTNLNGNFHNITVMGNYDPAKKTFTGTWEEFAHNTTCSDTWEAIPRN
jgi:hypothetical protein